jgi:tripartite ATP-independent transporter DctM subunit
MTPCASVSRAAPVALGISAGARLREMLVTAENLALALVFAVLVLLPLAEIALRATAGIGFEGSSSLVQHLTLAIGVLGAAVAAREDRLLGFAAPALLEGRLARVAKFLGCAAAAAVSALLCVAGLQFVGVERAAGRILAHGIPVWLVQSLLPLGFGIITVRLLLHSAGGAAGRLCALVLAAAAVAVFAFVPGPATVVAPALTALLAAAMLGAPLFAVIGGAALLLLWDSGVPIASVALNHYGLTSNPSLPAIPLFTLAGYFLAESGAPRRLIEVFDALFGRYRGGAAIVTVLACTFFTCFTGASGVAIVAIGGLAMPLLLAAGYRDRSALALITGGGLPGVLLFPALPLVLYAIVARTSIEAMFVGGFLPTLLMLGIALAWGIRQSPAARRDARPFEKARVLRALWTAKWDLSLPVVPLAILLGGLATPVEAAAATALYALAVATVVHRDVKLYPDLPRIMTECGLLVGGILLILGVSLGLNNYMVDAQIPTRVVEWVTQHIRSPWAFLLALNGFLLVIGCVMDIFSAIVLITPLVVPLGLAYGVHPVHLGIIFLANLELGYLTPPVGLNLFFSSYRFHRPIMEVCRSVAPLFLALCAGVLAITYLPWLSTALLGFAR